MVNAMLSSHHFETALGHFAIAWSEKGLARLALPESRPADAVSRLGLSSADLRTPPSAMLELVEAIGRYGEGEIVDFSFVEIDYGQADEFCGAIHDAARELLHGQTATYGELAGRAGHPGRARETGTALGRNPVPLVVPCHRVLAAGGRIGGFSANGGVAAKVRLLAHERADTAPRLPGQQSFAF
jgi:methylated-DNA-[protein]-cysteine S-methyltransferase